MDSMCEFDDARSEEVIMGMIGETLIQKGVINQGQLDKALEEQKKTGEKLGEVVIKLGFASKESVEAALK